MAAHHEPTSSLSESISPLFAAVAENVRLSGVFKSVHLGNPLECEALESAAAATYTLEYVPQTAAVYVGLAMADRWLSGSIESQLVEHGDKMEELLEDELVELDYAAAGGSPITKVEHFRSERKMFTFRAKVPLTSTPADAVIVTRALLAFEACFRQLGDMQGGSS